MTGPKNEHKANKWLLPILAVCSMLGVVFSIGGITLAAYLNTLQVTNQVKVDFSDLGQYFHSSQPNESDEGMTYVIQDTENGLSASEQLINLQKIVALGLLTESDIIKLGKDVTWNSPTPLLPIGSDEMPFNSTFDGAGHTITGLKVEGKDGRDVGMFGYTSVDSVVKNLILKSPTITVSRNSDGNDSLSGSIFERYYGQLSMPEIAITETISNEYITISNGGDNDTATVYGFPKTVTDDNGNVFAVNYKSSDDSIMRQNGETDANYTFSCYPFDTPAPNFDLAPVTISASVRYEINGQFGSYVLERYQFNVLGNGKISEATEDITNSAGVEYAGVLTGAFKTIHPKYEEHDCYVGFFIGHCDGKANHLGLDGGSSSGQDNGVIIIEDSARQSVYSARVLIGKSRLDNPVDASAGDTLQVIYDYAGAIHNQKDWGNDSSIRVVDIQSGADNTKEAYGYGYLDDDVANLYQVGNDGTTSNEHTPYNTNSEWGNQVVVGYKGNPVIDADFERQENNADALSAQVIPSETIRSYSKFYPGTNPEDAYKAGYGDSKLKPTSSDYGHSQSDAADSGFNAQVLDGGLGAATVARPAQTVGTGRLTFLAKDNDKYYYRLSRGMTVNNGFLIWSTKQFSQVFSTNMFYVNFDITYTVESDIEGDSNDDGTFSAYTGNNFQILYNAYNPDVIGSSALMRHPWSTSYSSYLFWQDLSYLLDFNNNPANEKPYNPAQYPIEAKYYISENGVRVPIEQTKQIQIQIDQETAASILQIATNIFNSLFGNNASAENDSSQYNIRYPAFAVGYGANGLHYYADYYDKNNSDGVRFIEGKDANGTKYVLGKDSDNQLDTKTFEASSGDVIGFQCYDPNSTTPGPRDVEITDHEENFFGIPTKYYSEEYNNRERAYFNTYFDVENNTKLFIKDFRVTFTNRIGNTESIIYNVDYVKNGQYVFDKNDGSWTAWPDASNVLLHFDYGSGSSKFSFYRGNSENPDDNYVRATYSGSTPVENTDGYAVAGITQVQP